ncbi:hypothetical protein NQ176_g9080 [Zarea fungicola]|uniref:Uncharacterized protein n=1 Tax=Zarea fungicola TaxID=93591 RepID=A0ACC1MNV8_9HYPO|nr:hypothetical protein NQ176_g9080 [Lecanicillium fungicola]
MANAAASSAAILSTMKHVTTSKWVKAIARHEEIKSLVQEAEASLSYITGVSSNHQQPEADVAVLLKIVRKAFAGSLQMQVGSRAGLRAKGGQLRYGASAFVSLGQRLDAIERMLSNAKYSSGFSKSAALSWRDELLGYLHQGQRRMEYSLLFGKLTNEWTDFRFGELSEYIQSDKQKEKSAQADDGIVAVGRKEMYEQRQIWEGLITKLRTTDTEKIKNFMDDLFHDGPRHQSARSVEELTDLRTTLLKRLRQKISASCKKPILITGSAVKSAIKAVLNADQLTSEKRRAMIDLSNRATVLDEIADILNIDMKLASLDRWSLGEKPIMAQMRKAINGKYRVYMDIELLDSILIQCVGQFISVNIRDALAQVWTSGMDAVWKAKEDEDLTASISAQIPEFASKRNRTNSIQALRKDIYTNIFFSPRLPKGMYDENSGRGYDDVDSEDGAQDATGLTDLVSGEASVLTIKTDILRVCAAEMGVQKLIYGQFCILQSDFEWFGPSLPHSTLITIMEYFRFPKELVNFLKAFLNMHIQFEEDGKDGTVLTRKTGIPVSFQITDGISELLLFVLDFAVNQRTSGVNLYRNHDDLWFWGQPDQCALAWEAIAEFTSVMGLEINKSKTAFMHATDESNPRFKAVNPATLVGMPRGTVKWGFLQFNPKEWQWVANKPAIEEHMDELRFQLESRTSVMAHIQAYNAYIKNFLPNNFGQVVVGLGDNHPAMVLEALQHAQRHLYRTKDGDKTQGSVAAHVRTAIKQQFRSADDDEIPDCFLYMNVENGGLGLADPAPAIAQYIQLPKKDSESEEARLPPMEAKLKAMNASISDSYRRDSKKFTESMSNKRHKHKLPQKQDDSRDSDSDEVSDTGPRSGSKPFTKKKGRVSMVNLYSALLDAPKRKEEDSVLSNGSWAASMFENELEEIFGGFIAEEEFLSLGLYRMLAEEKVRWTG